MKIGNKELQEFMNLQKSKHKIVLDKKVATEKLYQLTNIIYLIIKSHNGK